METAESKICLYLPNTETDFSWHLIDVWNNMLLLQYTNEVYSGCFWTFNIEKLWQWCEENNRNTLNMKKNKNSWCLKTELLLVACTCSMRREPWILELRYKHLRRTQAYIQPLSVHTLALVHCTYNMVLFIKVWEWYYFPENKSKSRCVIQMIVCLEKALTLFNLQYIPCQY